MNKKQEKENRALIIDTTAFVMGYEPTNIVDNQYSVPTISKELIPNSTPWIRFKIALESRSLKIRAPIKKYIDDVKKIVAKIGYTTRLSEVDTEVLALALELRDEEVEPVIISDDYSIQNIAEKLQIQYISLSTRGIRYQFEWSLYCPACHRRYPPTITLTICENCGNILKKRAIKKTPAKKLTKGGRKNQTGSLDI